MEKAQNCKSILIQKFLLYQEGTGLYTVGDKTIEVIGSEILIVPPGVPHKFINKGNIPLRQVDIHLSPKFITTWLEN